MIWPLVRLVLIAAAAIVPSGTIFRRPGRGLLSRKATDDLCRLIQRRRYGPLWASDCTIHRQAHSGAAVRTMSVNMPGANGMVLANQLYRSLPKDGTAIGTFDRAAALHAIWGNPAAQFVATELNWIGSTNVDTSLCVTWHTSGIDTLDKFLTREVVLGSTAIYHANLLNSLFGAKLKQVRGYPGGNDVVLALERGEVQGRCNWSWSSIISTTTRLDPRQEDQCLASVRGREASRPARCSARHGSREDRAAAPDARSRSLQPDDGPAVCGAARSSGRASQCAAQSVHGHDQGSGLPGSSEGPAVGGFAGEGEQIQDTLARISKTPKDVIRALRDVVLGAEASAAMEKQ